MGYDNKIFCRNSLVQRVLLSVCVFGGGMICACVFMSMCALLTDKCSNACVGGMCKGTVPFSLLCAFPAEHCGAND